MGLQRETSNGELTLGRGWDLFCSDWR